METDIAPERRRVYVAEAAKELQFIIRLLEHDHVALAIDEAREARRILRFVEKHWL